MPELPEVESARKFFALHCAGHRITKVITRESGNGPRHGLFDDIIFEDGKNPKTEALFKAALNGRELQAVKRKGKQLWLELTDSPNTLLLHFGMTGAIAIKDCPVPCYKAFKVSADCWPPRFTKLELHFSNGRQLAFCDPRRLGRIKLRSASPLNELPLSKLALDPSYEMPSCQSLLALLHTSTMPIKALLLDQEKVFCGIGNYLADEILYQSTIHPRLAASNISEEGAQRLINALQSVLQHAIAVDARYELFPQHWLFHYRWGKGDAKKKHTHMPDGNRIIFDDVGGRTTAIVENVQRMSNFSVNTAALKACNSNTTADVVAVVAVKRGKQQQKQNKLSPSEAAATTTTTAATATANATEVASSRRKKRPASAIEETLVATSATATATAVKTSKRTKRAPPQQQHTAKTTTTATRIAKGAKTKAITITATATVATSRAAGARRSSRLQQQL